MLQKHRAKLPAEEILGIARMDGETSEEAQRFDDALDLHNLFQLP